MVLVVPLERSGGRPREYPVAIIALKQPGRHRSARTDGLWIDDPTLHPIRFQAPFGLQKIGSGCCSIMQGIACSVTFQAGSRVAAEQAARHLGLLGCQNRDILWNVGERLP